MLEFRCPLREAALRSAQRPAVIGPDQTLSYGDLDRRVSAAAFQLKKSGCREGERVALWLPNGTASLVFILALFRIHAVACLLNTRLLYGNISPLLQGIGCGKLIALPDAGLGTALNEVQWLDPEAMLAAPTETPGPWIDYSFNADQPATVMFTSGSQGTPKAVLHSYANHWYSAHGANENVRLEPGDRWLLALPLYHAGGLGIVFRCMLRGAALVLPDPAGATEQTIDRYGVTHISMVPTQLYRSLRVWKKAHSTVGLKAVLLGGAPIPPALIREGHALGLPLFTSYGLTEMASQVTTTDSKTPLEKLTTAGKVLPYRRVQIQPTGEISVQGKTLFLGYLEGDRVLQAADSQGWFATGDVGQMDGEGYLTILGRQDNMFISGGENIHPEEIERVLCGLEGVEQAIVVPVPDEEFGERPFAFVQVAGQAINAKDMTKELSALLPRYKVPLGFHPLPDGAPPEGLKPQRRLLKQRALDARRERSS
ncbi:MAG TPA: o-succinylbenzoate--CoA ligase [Candidatus Binatia bacterium]